MSDLLDKRISNKIRSIFAIGIVCAHSFPTAQYPVLRYFALGYLWVGVFFFLSGYGLSYSINHKKDYLKVFCTSKSYGIYFPFVVAQAIYYFSVNVLMEKQSITMRGIASIFGIDLVFL